MKKLYFFLISNLFFLFPFVVNAEVVSMPPPTTNTNNIRVDSSESSQNYTYTGKATSGTWWDKPVYESVPNLDIQPNGSIGSLFYLPGDSQYIQTTFVNFEWANASGYCKGAERMSVTFEIYTLDPYFNLGNTYQVTAIGNGQQVFCSYSIIDSTKISARCAVKTGGNLQIALQPVGWVRSYNSKIAINKNVGFECTVEPGDIVNNLNQNTQNIIINNNDNTQQIIDSQNQIKDSITDSNVDSSGFDSFFSGFTTDTYGLTSIITSPLNLIGSITSSTCTPLGLPLPYVDKELKLPCMSEIYEEYFGSFLTIYQTITFGFTAYWVIVRIFNLVKDFKNPEHDEIEVLDL